MFLSDFLNISNKLEKELVLQKELDIYMIKLILDCW